MRDAKCHVIIISAIALRAKNVASGGMGNETGQFNRPGLTPLALNHNIFPGK